MNELEQDPVLHGMELQRAKHDSGTPGTGATQENNASTPRHINELEPDPGYAWNGTAMSPTGQWHSWNWYHTKINATALRHIHVNELEPNPSYAWNGTA